MTDGNTPNPATGAAAKPKAKAPAKPRAARKPKAPKLDAGRLRELAGEVDAKLNQHLPDLVKRLETEDGMEVTADDDGVTRVRLAGVDAQSTAGIHGAMANWANAARRAAQRAEAGE